MIKATGPAALEGHGDGDEGGFGRSDAVGLEAASQGLAELDAQVEGESAGTGVLGFKDGGSERAGPGAQADGAGPREAGVSAIGAGLWGAGDFVGADRGGAAGAIGVGRVGSPVGVGGADGPGWGKQAQEGSFEREAEGGRLGASKLRVRRGMSLRSLENCFFGSDIS